MKQAILTMGAGLKACVSHKAVVVVAVTAMILGACAETRPPEFYTLSSLRGSGGGLVPGGAGPSIGIGPISLPQYVDRPQIVTRSSPNRLALAEFHKWAEPLSDIFARVLADNLGILMATDQIVVLPRRRNLPIDYQIEVDVTQFDTDIDGKTRLVARWTLFGKGGREALLTGESSISNTAANPADYESIVAAMSRAVEALSREVADTIRAAMV